MVFRFDNFCERFAQCYLGHVPSKDGRQARFFRHNSIDEDAEIHKRLAAFDQCDLFMSVITATDGELTRTSENAPSPNFYVWRRHVLFWTHQDAATQSRVPNDEEAAADAKARGVDAATDFIAFMAYLKDPKKGNVTELAGVDLDSIEIASLSMHFSGWWVTVINFDQLEPRQKCVLGEHYDRQMLEELFPGVRFDMR